MAEELIIIAAIDRSSQLYALKITLTTLTFSGAAIRAKIVAVRPVLWFNGIRLVGVPARPPGAAFAHLSIAHPPPFEIKLLRSVRFFGSMAVDWFEYRLVGLVRSDGRTRTLPLFRFGLPPSLFGAA